MLVLTRKERERIRIGDDIFVEVVEITRGKVRLGISAPREVVVVRTELDEPRPKSQNQPEGK